MRLFLMRYFHMSVDEFHSIYNPAYGPALCCCWLCAASHPGWCSNCETFTLGLQPSGRYKIMHPLRAGGKFPPPQVRGRT